MLTIIRTTVLLLLCPLIVLLLSWLPIKLKNFSAILLSYLGLQANRTVLVTSLPLMLLITCLLFLL